MKQYYCHNNNIHIIKKLSFLKKNEDLKKKIDFKYIYFLLHQNSI